MRMATIGQTLSAARIAAGCSLEHLSTRTRIRMQVLRAIENEDFVPCGGDFYARGHIRRICKFLGVDPEPLLEEYEREHASKEKPTFVPPPRHPAASPKAARATAGGGGGRGRSEEGGHEIPARIGDEDIDPEQRAENWGHFERNKRLAKRTEPADRPGRRRPAAAAAVPGPREGEGARKRDGRGPGRGDDRRPPRGRPAGALAGRAGPAGGVRRHWPWAVVGLILVAAVVVGVRAWQDEESGPVRTAFDAMRDKERDGDEAAGSVVLPEEGAVVGKAQGEEGVKEAEEPEEFTVELNGSGRSWVKVTDAEGENLFTGFLLEGETRDYVTEVPLELWVGNAGEVAVAVDGEDLGPSGGVGEVKEFTVGAEGIGD
ncbi:helix-turn-helix domain-containing protein [Nocardiopsis alba]|uniref:DUF4115 domain-containing protein n=1 Tax=Nocardiopsis alba TaxID=53437 RepID=A0A7K2IWL3_9ACTN|nr:helix-turn-helix domain-containing protein [Nocardiopsis alba]MYR34236.1 DUF4115 domain-containing protein [Nocardiopsis alba]